MEHTYTVTSMSCKVCKNRVEQALSQVQGVTKVSVDLEKSEALIKMDAHIATDQFQNSLNQAGAHYQIHEPGETKKTASCCNTPAKQPDVGNGIFYCPMQCEGDKTYNSPVGCPVCGMDLVEQPMLKDVVEYTCETHPSVSLDKPGTCPICGRNLVKKEPEESAEDKSYRELLKKFILTLVFTIPVFLISMDDMIPGNPIQSIGNLDMLNRVQFFLTLPVVFYTCNVFFVRAYKSVITMNLNMFTLIGIGTGAAFLFSITGLFFPGIFPDNFKTESGTVHLYFESSVVILALAMLGQLLEARAHRQTGSALRELLNLAPSEATWVDNGQDKLISVSDIKIGNILRVKPGDKIPVDGTIREGVAVIDESMITGEPVPVDKGIGDKISAGTVNLTESFTMTAERIGADTLLFQIIQMVNSAGRSRAPIQKLADTVSKYFVPLVFATSILTFGFWALFSADTSLIFAFTNAVAVLIVACPCALGLATPMSVMVGVGKGARLGILVKNAESLELINKVNVLITDKTGTLTKGKPAVEKIVALDAGKETELAEQVYSLNIHSSHPLAKAIVNFGNNKKLTQIPVDNFENVTGKGISGIINGKMIAIGNAKMMEAIGAQLTGEIKENAEKEQNQGKTVSFITVDATIRGYITIFDPIKETSALALAGLMEQGVEVIMMTGDHPNTAKNVADTLGIKDYQAECLPNDKMEMIETLQKKGKCVAMAGDGINDAPALALADVGIAMGTGTGIAMENSGITLVKGDLLGIVKAIKLSTLVMRNIRQNLFFAFIYNIIGVVVASGLLYSAFGILLSPMVAALAMSFSSVSVISNSLRLRSTRLV